LNSIFQKQQSRIAMAIGACGLIVLGFFLPWLEGAGIMDLRSFSGFDLARLARNFEIAADSEAGAGRIRATALALYLVPALAINAAIFEASTFRLRETLPMARLACLTAGVYAVVVLAAVLLLSQAPFNGFELVAGTPAWGFVVTAAGAVLSIVLGVQSASRALAA
jgi:hypothetical protein